MTGISVRKEKGPGKLVFLDRTDLEIANEIEIGQTVRFLSVNLQPGRSNSADFL